MAFYSRRKLISTSINKNRYVDSPIGFFLGSDSLFLSSWFSYNLGNELDMSIGWEYWDRVVNNNIIGDELIISYAEGSSGIKSSTNLIFLMGSYQFSDKISFDLKERLFITNDLLNVISLSINLKF